MSGELKPNPPPGSLELAAKAVRDADPTPDLEARLAVLEKWLAVEIERVGKIRDKVNANERRLAALDKKLMRIERELHPIRHEPGMMAPQHIRGAGELGPGCTGGEKREEAG